MNALTAEGAVVKIIAPLMGNIKGDKGTAIKVDQSFLIAASVLFDAVYVPGGAKSVATLKEIADAVHFINEAYKHCKAIAADGEGVQLLEQSYIGNKYGADNFSGKDLAADGVIIDKAPKDFIKAIAQHRFWEREQLHKVPA